MTYSAPIGMGCGGTTFKKILEFIRAVRECGIVVSKFNRFNFVTADRGTIIYLLDQTQHKVFDAVSKLESKAYPHSLPRAFRVLLTLCISITE